MILILIITAFIFLNVIMIANYLNNDLKDSQTKLRSLKENIDC
jgi:hypothetical protein